MISEVNTKIARYVRRKLPDKDCNLTVLDPDITTPETLYSTQGSFVQWKFRMDRGQILKPRIQILQIRLAVFFSWLQKSSLEDCRDSLKRQRQGGQVQTQNHPTAPPRKPFTERSESSLVEIKDGSWSNSKSASDSVPKRALLNSYVLYKPLASRRQLNKRKIVKYKFSDFTR